MIRKLIAAVFLLLLLAVIAIFFVSSTEKGLTILWQQASKFLPNAITIETVEGRLIGPIIINGFNYQNESIKIAFDRARLSWDPSYLMSLTLQVDAAEIDNLKISQIGQKIDNDEPISLPDEIKLPLKIVVEQFRVNQFEFRNLAGTEPFLLEYATLVGVFDNDQFLISELNIEGSKLSVTGNLQTIPHSDYASQGELHWNFTAKDLPTFNGITVYEGDLQKLEIKQTIQQPYNLSANMSAHNLLDAFGFSANIDLSQLNLQNIKNDLPQATITGVFDVEGDLDSVNIQANLKSNQTDYGTLHAELNSSVSQKLIEINSLTLTAKEKPTQLLAQGKINLTDEDSIIDVKANWKDLDWPLLEKPSLQSKKGKLSIAGTLEQYTFNAMATLNVPDSLDADVSLTGIGDKHSANITQLDAKTLQGTITGSSQIQWQPKLEARVALIGKNINPQQLAANWPGKLHFELKANASQEQENITAVFEQLQADGTLRNYKIQMSAKGKYNNEILNLEKFNLTSGETQITANGAIGKKLDLQWKVDSENINSLLPDASGKINGQGIVKGLIKQPFLEGRLSGQKLAYQDYKIESINLNMDFDLENKQQSTLTLVLDDLKFNKTLIKTAEAELQGKLDNHTLKFNLDSNQGQVELVLDGNFTNLDKDEPSWEFQLKQGQISYPKLAPWNLQSSSSGRISKNITEINETCWASNQAGVCIDATNEQNNVAAKFTLNKLPFSYFKEFLQEDWEIAGDMSGEGSYISDPQSIAKVDMQINTTAIELSLPGEGGETITALAFKPGNISVIQNESGLQAKFSLPLKKNGGVDFAANVIPGTDPVSKRPLTGDLKIRIDNLSDYEELFPQVEQLKGKIDGDILLSGSMQNPAFNGELKLEDAAADLPDYGLALNKINIAITGAEANDLAVNGSVNSGEGVLNIMGTLSFKEKGNNTKLELSGDKFEIYNTQDAHIFASPDLQIDIEGKKVDITGDVAIPRATITPNKNTNTGTVTVSEDQVIVVPKGEQQVNPYLVTTNVSLHIGPDVHLSTYGLEADLSGDIAITDKPKKRTKGKGELNLTEGKFQAYGQELIIERGKIIFGGGPIDQPGIDLRASRKPRKDILVGVDVRGNFNKPNIKLFSDPSMRRAEQLSYLTLGKPLQDASAGESSAINQAALSIGFSKSSKITDEIGKQLGFDSAGFESSKSASGNQSAFVLGKYLSPKLYVSYGIGIFEPVNVFRLQYFLTKHWKVVTESSGGSSGGDIYYEIERGK